MEGKDDLVTEKPSTDEKEPTAQTEAVAEVGPTEDSKKEEAESSASISPTQQSTPSSSKSDPPDMAGEKIDFKVVYNKKKFDVSFGSEETVGALKSHLQDVIGVPSTMQKVMIKGLAKDEMTLKKLGVSKGSKIMVVGSTLNDVLEVTKKPSVQQLKEEESKDAQKESLSQQKQHKKVLEKGLPDDVMPGIKNSREALPPFPISGMLNKTGGKVRLTFKLELDQLWIGTKERTQKIPLNSIKTVVSEEIEGHEEYSMMALQLGPTEASRYWIYWVPNQYVEAIKEAILGKWQLF
eukprot:TRINITY_DN629_c0_g1_i1.p1 TRINITY_DN629_c0_g1~~TRINITY_DN629_c0_g1_i1.p1  ORF type:complete len:294 (-),score=74.14 TRINITY_DN629_c0_g1_i1:136-1017(-)